MRLHWISGAGVGADVPIVSSSGLRVSSDNNNPQYTQCRKYTTLQSTSPSVSLLGVELYFNWSKLLTSSILTNAETHTQAQSKYNLSCLQTSLMSPSKHDKMRYWCQHQYFMSTSPNIRYPVPHPEPWVVHWRGQERWWIQEEDTNWLQRSFQEP